MEYSFVPLLSTAHNHIHILMSKEYTIKNYTNSKITFKVKEGEVSIHSDGVAKCEIHREYIGLEAYVGKEKIKTNLTTIHRVTGLPEPEENVIYIVSMLVYLCMFKDRNDVFIVDEPVKDKGKRVIASRALARPVYPDLDKHMKERGV